MRTFTFITYSPDAHYAPVVVEVRGDLLSGSIARTTRHISNFASGRGWIIQEIHQLEAENVAAARHWFVSYIADLPRRQLFAE